MSFVTLSKPELLAAAEEFGVVLDAGETWTKPKIAAELVELGVTWEMYKESFPDPSDDDTDEPVELAVAPRPVQAKAAGPTVLLQMTRANGTYQTRGYKFTRDNPFLPVDEENAEWILEHLEGFKIASPKAAREFYS